MTRSKQYHTDGPSQGFVPVHTSKAEQPKWSVEVGAVGYGSPVIGADGTIYVGTLSGHLVAINPTGTIIWKLELTPHGSANYPGVVTGSPAVGSDGNIYVVTTVNQIVRDHRGGADKEFRVRKSCLHSVSPAGFLNWTFDFPKNATPTGLGGYTTSSPKVWGDGEIHIFVPAVFSSGALGGGYAVELIVINQFGNLAFRTDIASYPPSTIVGEGPGLGDILDAIWDFISSPVDFDTSGVGPTLEETFGWPEPTVAVVDYPKFADGPLIVIDDNYKTMAAFRFRSRVLMPLWKKTSTDGRLRSSPAVFANNLLAIGQKDGTVSFFDVETGDEIWKPWYKASKPVMSPSASFGRQVFFVADKQLIVLDSNSELWKKQNLGGKCLGAPTLSASFVYVSANDGLYTFTFDLQEHTKNSDVIGGVSSPVIADDGTVYVMDLNKRLWAFGGNQNSKPKLITRIRELLHI
jgi:outer membrane protein assembly factor BamB